MITIKRYPWDNGYYKIIIKIPFTHITVVWTKYAVGWFGIRINK